jgi:hypothetical protein
MENSSFLVQRLSVYDAVTQSLKKYEPEKPILRKLEETSP